MKTMFLIGLLSVSLSQAQYYPGFTITQKQWQDFLQQQKSNDDRIEYLESRIATAGHLISIGHSFYATGLTVSIIGGILILTHLDQTDSVKFKIGISMSGVGILCNIIGLHLYGWSGGIFEQVKREIQEHE